MPDVSVISIKCGRSSEHLASTSTTCESPANRRKELSQQIHSLFRKIEIINKSMEHLDKNNVFIKTRREKKLSQIASIRHELNNLITERKSIDIRDAC